MLIFYKGSREGLDAVEDTVSALCRGCKEYGTWIWAGTEQVGQHRLYALVPGSEISRIRLCNVSTNNKYQDSLSLAADSFLGVPTGRSGDKAVTGLPLGAGSMVYYRG